MAQTGKRARARARYDLLAVIDAELDARRALYDARNRGDARGIILAGEALMAAEREAREFVQVNVYDAEPRWVDGA